jgi:monoamine oxidase
VRKKIVIIGAGLSGLLTAYRLLDKGFDIEIVEARNRIGGRIHSVHSEKACVELGATWFNETHKNIISLLEEFEIGIYEQFMKGKSFFESNSDTPAQIIDIPENSPSYRIVGGTSQIIEKIKDQLKDVTFHLKDAVTEIDFTEEIVLVKTIKQTISADLIISTIPQPLLVSTINFSPSLPNQLISIANKTHTWMQDSIKIALVYKTPFWRTKGMSGAIFSNVGPITEFYDQTNYELDKFALCGFASTALTIYEKEERKTQVLLQIEKILGKDVLDYTDYLETIWSEEEFTKNTKQDDFIFPHQNNGHPIFRESYYNNRLFLSGTETALQYPGYMEGAIISTNQVVSAILNL